MYIAIAVLAGGAALWAVNMPHHSLTGVLWQLVAIVVLARAFVVGRRAISTKLQRDRVGGAHNVVVAHDEQGRTPVERLFN